MQLAAGFFSLQIIFAKGTVFVEKNVNVANKEISGKTYTENKYIGKEERKAQGGQGGINAHPSDRPGMSYADAVRSGQKCGPVPGLAQNPKNDVSNLEALRGQNARP